MPAHSRRRQDTSFYPSESTQDATDALMEMHQIYGNAANQAVPPPAPAPPTPTLAAAEAEVDDSALAAEYAEWSPGPVPLPSQPAFELASLEPPPAMHAIGASPELAVQRDGKGFALGEHRLEPERNLGKGTFGSVDRMVDRQTGGSMVVKSSTENGSSADLLHEAEVYSQIGPHPNIVGYHGVTRDDNDNTALALESESDRLDMIGCGLRRQLKEGEISEAEFWAAMRHLGRGTLDGIQAIHDAGLVHSDIKPDNVLVSEDGDAKIGDMGTVFPPNDPRAQIAGTPKYMAPEAGEQGEDRHGRDVFSFGQTMAVARDGTLQCGDRRIGQYGLPNGGYEAERDKQRKNGQAPAPALPIAATNQELFDDLVCGTTALEVDQRLTLDEAKAHPFLAAPVRTGVPARDLELDTEEGRRTVQRVTQPRR
jgi:serine/threonine protein kinase